MLQTLIKDRLHSRDISIREAAREIGISHTTLNRILTEGSNVDLPTIQTLATWLGVSLTTAIGIEDDKSDVASAVTALIETEPQLANTFVRAAKEVMDGTLTGDDFRDILEYAMYKINSRRANAAKSKNEVSGGD